MVELLKARDFLCHDINILCMLGLIKNFDRNFEIFVMLARSKEDTSVVTATKLSTTLDPIIALQLLYLAKHANISGECTLTLVDQVHCAFLILLLYLLVFVSQTGSHLASISNFSF